MGTSMQPPRGRLGTRAVLGGHGTQLKKGELEMRVSEDFLVVRTAGLENSLPREGRGTPSRGTLGTRQSMPVRAWLKAETLL